MNLETLFPGFEIIRTSVPDSPRLPPVWKHLASSPPDEGLLEIVDCLGVDESSHLSEAIKASLDLGIVAPKRKREKSISGMWTLAILYSPSRALMFGCPAADVLQCPAELPSHYQKVVSNLGSMRFDQYSGMLIWPASMRNIANKIALAEEGAQKAHAIPFFDHKTGDYDCWLDGDFNTSYFFDHESGSLKIYCDGGFVKWMERRFEETMRA